MHPAPPNSDKNTASPANTANEEATNKETTIPNATQRPFTEHTAEVSHRRSLSLIWFIPFLALIIGLWMVFQQWYNQGPLITLEFEHATGLEAQKTKIKTRELDVGHVTSITLKEGAQGIIVQARLDKHVASLLTEDSQFWVVSPRVTRSGISGLNTLLSGSYIEFAPGTSGQSRRAFIGLEEPPVTASGTPGAHLQLVSQDRFEFAAGDPIVYKGLNVGQFETVEFDVDERKVHYRVFIRAPYHELIDHNTQFWRASGVSVSLTADGINVQTASLQSVFSNAVTFGTPKGSRNGHKGTVPESFLIYSSEEAAATPIYRASAEFVILVTDTVRGLSVGAPVEYRGINIGEVKTINLKEEGRGDLLQHDYEIPVLISLIPGKIGWPDSKKSVNQLKEQIQIWIEQGLKARLQTGNLLTGQLFVELQHYPEESTGSLAHHGEFPIIPTTPDDFSQIAQSTGNLLEKLNKLPLENIVESANSALVNAADAITTLNSLSKDIESLIEQAHSEELISQLNQALGAIRHLAAGYSQGSPGYDEIVNSMESLNQRLLDLKPLLRQLNEKPNSLVFTGRKGEDRQPQASPLKP
ncbi:intermembrane transport protein PqiB [Marinibactrum halimedae]|uniref:Paraquat-inducible protein B n=1 Tax=Marinibactrum halimedae TaxID=1444977 RepID=A0AA37T955_9GAMM|nr:intermembrane transport protein PqiB [Marinibactrum halimedae]MCD9460554.1 intermembrane transport protein PqiB [Marinibactrum halimedae]GLS27182.1 paraquat-inducible protein B [Marinibactrum halimedae]